MKKISLEKIIKLKLYFLRGKYLKIENMINLTPELIKALNHNEILLLAYYAEKNISRHLMHSILNYAYDMLDHESKITLIKYLYIKSNGRMIPYNDFFEIYFEDFLEVGLSTQNIFFLEHIAKIIDKNPEKYKYEIEVILSIFMTKQIDAPSIHVACLKSFATEKFLKKILSSGIDNALALLKNFDQNQSLEILKYIFKMNYSKEELKMIFKEYISKGLEEKLILCIKNRIIDKNIQSKYLLLIYKLSPNDNLARYILLLNNINVTSELISIIGEEKCNLFIDDIIENQEEDLYLNLACLTKCTNTYKLISLILVRNNINETCLMVASLKKQYLYYALNSLVKHNIKFYIKIVKRLYALGLDNLYEAIEFIYTNQYDYLFDKKLLDGLGEIPINYENKPIVKK